MKPNGGLSVHLRTVLDVDEQVRPYRQGGQPPTQNDDDQRRWVVSKDANPRMRMALGPDAAQRFVANNPGWTAIADDNPRWLPYQPGLPSNS